MYLGVHSEEGVRASAAQGRSFKGLAMVKMVEIFQVSNLQNRNRILPINTIVHIASKSLSHRYSPLSERLTLFPEETDLPVPIMVPLVSLAHGQCL